jgi:hypothetical protein
MTSIDDVFLQCVWFKSSTNKETLKQDTPPYCLIKNCDGYNFKCQAYQKREDYFKNKVKELKTDGK